MNHTIKDTTEKMKGINSFSFDVLKKVALVFLVLVILVSISLFLFLVRQKPSHDRDWELGQEKLPQILLEGNEIVVKNLRDFRWTGPFEARPN
ncbi:MAG: hypothetical protein EOM19_08335, partial [Candidatus Moranbacteria bacterium]|nr:hypothetical protein [Candidatus Moranbacteria bacterium]